MRAPPVAPVGDRNPWQFSIASLLALTTLVAVCLGLAIQAPGLATALAIASVPALIRTFGISNMWRKAGQPLTFSEQCLSFGGSLLVVTAVAASLVTAFLIVFVPLCGLSRIGMSAPNHGIEKAMEIGAWILGAAAGLSVAGIAFYELWLWWHFRFRKEGMPPTLDERLGRFGYTAVLVLVPLCAGVAAAMASGWMMGMAGRPAHGYATSSARAATYVAAVIGFLAAWSLTTWMCVRHFQRIWRVVAVMLAAYFGCSLGAGIAVSWLTILFPPQSEGVLVVIGAFTGLIVGAWICIHLLRPWRSASAR
jgi:hypothetical protein